jgi:hypothetical protein
VQHALGRAAAAAKEPCGWLRRAGGAPAAGGVGAGQARCATHCILATEVCSCCWELASFETSVLPSPAESLAGVLAGVLAAVLARDMGAGSAVAARLEPV